MTLLHREHHRSLPVPTTRPRTRLSGCAPLSQREHMDSDSPRSSVRRHVRAERERRGWTQTDLAVAAGVSRGSVANLEGGTRLTEGKESKIEAALGKPVGWLDSLRNGSAGEATVEPLPQPPALDALGMVPAEIVYFGERLKDTPEDLPRLLRLLELYHQMKVQQGPAITDGTQSGMDS